MTCIREGDVLEMFAGTFPADRAEELERHFETCELCRAQREELEAIASRLRPSPNEFEDRELVKDVSTLIRLERLPQTRRSWPYVLVPVALAASLAAVFVTPADEGFTPRSSRRIEPDRWVSIEAHAKKEDGLGYEKVDADIGTSEPLVFSVLNRPESPYKYGMIFAFDEHGETFWYYPAFLDPAENPKSIEITASRDPLPLPEAVRHTFEPGWLRVVGLFSTEPQDVKSIEAAVRRATTERRITELDRLPIDGTGQHSFLLRVEGDR